MSTKEVLDEYYDNILSRFPKELQGIERKYGISLAEVKDHTFTVVKSQLIKGLEEKQKNACKQSNRNPDEVKLLLATKTVSVERIKIALQIGIH